MRVHSAIFSVAILVAASAAADVYRVSNRKDSGEHSLRWAIEQANSHAGRDKIVFAARLAGKVIRPTTALPYIQDYRTIVEGDINDDGQPDVAVNGEKLTTGPCLSVRHANHCRISGLAITNSPSSGLYLFDCRYTTIRRCHIGVNLAGTTMVPNGGNDVYAQTCSYNTIGGSLPADRNIIAGGGTSVSSGLRLDMDSYDNTIVGNYFGLTRDGMTAFGGRYGGIYIKDSGDNTVGGTGTNDGNVFGGLDRCLSLVETHDCTVAGNYFGLAADGSSLLPINIGVILSQASTGNTIGGTGPGARNVFAGNADFGVQFIDSGTENNKVKGNYFGLNAAGTGQRRLRTCVSVVGGDGSPGAQTIGGGTAAAGNYFVPKTSSFPTAIELNQAGDGTLIRRNKLGVRPDGRDAIAMTFGVAITGVDAVILDNTFVRAENAIAISTAGANPRIFRNTFRACDIGVYLENDARCVLGNLGNSNPADDGGNLFRPSNTWHVQNFTTNRILAEGNGFGTTSRAAIDAKIWDRRDSGTRGRVDFNPLIGGVAPTGETPSLSIAASAAVPTEAGGAEICFRLSVPADVTVDVLNIAGRPVSTVLRGSATISGLQRVIWSGQTGPGTRAPNGTYLVRIVARDENGQQAQSLCSVQLGR